MKCSACGYEYEEHFDISKNDIVHTGGDYPFQLIQGTFLINQDRGYWRADTVKQATLYA